MTDDPYQLRKPTEDEWPTLARMINLAFASDTPEEEIEQRRRFFRPEESDLIVHNGEMVAHSALLNRDLTVPGAVVPTAHVSAVVVAPTHRRRGLLSRLMVHQLRKIRAEGRQPIAALWASEGRIYQRFGYGLAVLSQRLTIETREVGLRPGPAPAAGTLRTVDKAGAREDLRTVYEAARVDRPGWSSRDGLWWDQVLDDPEHSRQGWTGYRVLLYADAEGTARGYAIWRTKQEWDHGGPKGTVQVIETVATSTDAYAAIWRFLLTVDLTRTVILRFASSGEPLLYMVDELRRLRPQVADGLWVRIVDLPAALAARRYAAPLDVVLEVTDALLPENAGRWRLRVDRDGAGTCEASTDAPDLECDVADLAALYFGGTPIGALADAGRVRECTAGALLATAAAFTWHRAPSGIEIF